MMSIRFPKLHTFLLEGYIGVDYQYSEPRRIGRLIFEEKSCYWNCHHQCLENHLKEKEDFVLSSRTISFLPDDFVHLASNGYFSFYHKPGNLVVRCWCDPASEDLEDIVLLMQSVCYRRSFKEQKLKYGKLVHECFIKNADPTHRKLKSPRQHGVGGDSNCYVNNLKVFKRNVDRDDPDKYGRPPRGQNSSPNAVRYGDKSKLFEQNQCQPTKFTKGDRWQAFGSSSDSESPPHTPRSEKGRDFGYFPDRNKFYSASLPQPVTVSNLWSYRDQRHGGRGRGGWREKSSTSDSSSKESPERRQMPNQERMCRSQQPLRDRGSGENSTNNAGRSESSRGQKSSSNAVRYGDESQQPEQNQFQSTKFSNGDKSQALRSSTDSANKLRTPESENGRVFALSPNRSTSTSQQVTFYNKPSPLAPPVSTYNSFSKRNDHHLSPRSAKKAKFDVTILREDKENAQDTVLAVRESTYSGFKNLGNTCYMNTALQAVFNLDQFASNLLETYSRFKSMLTPNSILAAMCELLDATKKGNKWKSADHFENELSALVTAVRKEWKEFNVNVMQDSHEFLYRILCSANETLADKLPKVHNPIKKYFGFELLRMYTCTKCFNNTIKREQQYDIGVSVSNRIRSLQKLLESSFTAEEIELKCTICENNRCNVKVQFHSLPRILIVHLKRYKSLIGSAVKIETPVRLPECVTLKDFMSPNCTVDFSGSNDSLPHSRDASSTKVDCQPESRATSMNYDIALDWHLTESSEDEQIKNAISDSLVEVVEDPQLTDEIEKAKELSLRELQQQNVIFLSTDEDEDADDENEREVYEDNFQTGHLPHSYRLATVIKHTGSVAQGHYTCLVSDCKQNWRVLDDAAVKNISKEEALQIAGKHGYVMFYVHTSLLKGPSG